MRELPPTDVFVSRGIFFLYRTGKPELKSERKNQELKYVFNKAKKRRYRFNPEGHFDSIFLLFKCVWVSNNFASLCTAINLSPHCTLIAGLVFLLCHGFGKHGAYVPVVLIPLARRGAFWFRALAQFEGRSFQCPHVHMPVWITACLWSKYPKFPFHGVKSSASLQVCTKCTL